MITEQVFLSVLYMRLFHIHSYHIGGRKHVNIGGIHAVILHGHEYCVYHDANGDKQICKGVHHNHVDDFLYLQPRGTAIPDQIIICKLEPVDHTLLLPDLRRCKTRRWQSESCIWTSMNFDNIWSEQKWGNRHFIKTSSSFFWEMKRAAMKVNLSCQTSKRQYKHH